MAYRTVAPPPILLLSISTNGTSREVLGSYLLRLVVVCTRYWELVGTCDHSTTILPPQDEMVQLSQLQGLVLKSTKLKQSSTIARRRCYAIYIYTCTRPTPQGLFLLNQALTCFCPTKDSFPYPSVSKIDHIVAFSNNSNRRPSQTDHRRSRSLLAS